MLNSIDELPKIPKVAKQFSEAVARGDDLKAISDIISKDISISAKVLQIVNSAFYSGERISSISRAVSIMGLTSLKNIVLSAAFSMEESLPKLQTDFIIDTANRMLRTNKIFLKIYGLKYGLPVPEDYAAIGLVFNIGKIIIAKYFPERFNKILAEMKNKKVDFLTAELNLGYKDATHCEIGGYFLELWNFSKENIESSLFHHIPDLCPQDISKIMKMLQKACEHEKTLTDEQLDKIMATEKL
jgi:HD-like signal output (HDOD) protein